MISTFEAVLALNSRDWNKRLPSMQAATPVSVSRGGFAWAVLFGGTRLSWCMQKPDIIDAHKFEAQDSTSVLITGPLYHYAPV